MAQIILNIPDPILPRVVDDIATKFNFALNGLNQETKGAFAKRMMITTVKQWLKDVEGSAPYDTARQNQAVVESDIDNNVSIT